MCVLCMLLAYHRTILQQNSDVRSPFTTWVGPVGGARVDSYRLSEHLWSPKYLRLRDTYAHASKNRECCYTKTLVSIARVALAEQSLACPVRAQTVLHLLQK